MITNLVSDLPEVYQPIYGHPELSGKVSRPCQDRLEKIAKAHDALQRLLDRPLNVLDLGCAQGYFSLNLAERGAIVHGVDYLEKNIAVCNALAQSHPLLKVSFEAGRIEDAIARLEPGQYDLVLGLSVFHHLVYEKGVDVVKGLLNVAAHQSGALLVEFALHEEPLYWAPSLPQDPRLMLESIAFVHEVARHGTHLAPIPRPLFVASNHYWLLAGNAGSFDTWTTDPHILAHGVHGGSRRYYFSPDIVLKYYRFDHPGGKHNKSDFAREKQFLESSPIGFPAPARTIICENSTEGWLGMTRLPGKLLVNLLHDGANIDHRAVLLEVLRQLALLEAAGLYHDDVRTWNVLVAEDGAVHLIDYASISQKKQDCVWPWNPFLSFFIFVREVATGIVDDPSPLRTISISPFGLPRPYCAWATSIWHHSMAEWSFQLMHETLMKMTNNINGESLQQPIEAWMKATEEAIQAQTMFIRQAVHQTEAKAQQAEARAQQVEARAQQSEARAQQSEASAQQSEARAQQSEASAQQSEARAQQSEASAQQSEARAQQSEARAQQSEAKAQQSEARAQQSEARAQQSEARAQQSEASAQQSEARAQQSEIQTQQLEARALQSEARAKHAEGKVDELNQSSHHWWLEADRLKSELDTAKVKNEELNQSSHHWWSVADRVSHELQDIYTSKFWLITTPLRQVMLVTRWMINLPVRLAKYVAQAILASNRNSPLRRVLRSVLLLALTVVRAVPFIKPLVRRLVVRFPSISSQLQAFAYAHRPKHPHHRHVPKVHHPDELAAGFSSTYVEVNGGMLQHALSKGQRVIYLYVDHTVGCPVNTGMQRLVRGLARAFLESGEQLRFVKWDFESRQLVLVNRDELDHLARWHGPKLTPEAVATYPISGSAGIGISAHQTEEANWLVVPEVPYINNHPTAVTRDVIMASKRAGLRSAFVFYDATPLRRKELSEMAPKHEEYMQQLLLVDLVVPISEWSASDLMAFFTHHEFANQNTIPKIATLPLTGESHVSQRVNTIRDDTRKLVLSVGSITQHKNQLALVQAFEIFTRRHPESSWELALVGNVHDDMSTELKAAAIRTPSIKVLNNLSDEALGRLYNECAFTVFPSVMEGFGLPILESLWHGKPCVCANFGAMAEVAKGGGCLTVDVRSSDAIVAAIEQLVVEPESLSRLRNEALARPLADWRDYAKKFSGEIDRITNPVNQIGVVFYWIDHTCIYHANSGIQRVVRGLARALVELGVNLVPVKWSRELQRFCAPTRDELVNVARWNGPSVDGWTDWRDPTNASIYDWLLIPELLTDPAGPSGATIKQQAAKYGIRSAWIFYDAIPWKMGDIYTQDQAANHSQYMRGLNQFELVMAISEFSRNDLTRFLRGIPDRTPNLEDRIRACVLPGEFKESPRVLQTRPVEPHGLIRILCVCTVEPRKNHLTLLEAFKQVVRGGGREVELCLVGGAPFPELTEQVQHYIDTVPGIRWERNADDARLRELYNECNFTVYPSLEEGFGLPILESIWHARPCITRNSGAMAEVAQGGGCLMVETAEVQPLADAISQLINDENLCQRLSSETVVRAFRTWNDYARDVVTLLANERSLPIRQQLPQILQVIEYKQEAINLSFQPLLSICISTYNRAAWLGLSLKNLERLIPIPLDEVEIVVCDNTSTDNTPEVVKPYMGRKDFRYCRNLRNVGMLGNLQVTAHHARGRHVWILGDDDLVKSGSIERILKVLRDAPNLALVYLNYAYTREDDANAVTDLDKFLAESIPVAAPCPDISGPVWKISTESENFFTAIYCLVFRRDHALKAYSQNTEGRPFSSMLTCIPTTYHVLHHMMGEEARWIGEPQLVVNLNVSWMKYASIWILERLPEAFDIAEKMGAAPSALDNCRVKHLKHINHWYYEMLINDDPEGNAAYFNPVRLFSRFKHLHEFRSKMPEYIEAYCKAHNEHPTRFPRPPEDVYLARLPNSDAGSNIV